MAINVEIEVGTSKALKSINDLELEANRYISKQIN